MTDTVTRGQGPPNYSVVLVKDETIKGGYPADTAEEAGRACMVLAQTFGLDDGLRIEVRQPQKVDQ